MSYVSLEGMTKKTERKFYISKPEHLAQDLQKFYDTYGLDSMDIYGIKQVENESREKYREVWLGVNCTHTRQTRLTTSDHEKEVNIEIISPEEFTVGFEKAENKVYKVRTSVKLRSIPVYLTIDRFLSPYAGLALIELWSVNDFDIMSVDMHFKSLIEVTGNDYFTNLSISKKLLSDKVVVLEGTDFVGKTTIAKELLSLGYRIQDRDMENFSNQLLLSIPLLDTIKAIGNLDAIEDKIYVVLTNSDKCEIDRRRKLRELTEGLSQFDTEANTYNLMYDAVMTYLKETNTLPKNVIHIECSGLELQAIMPVIINKLPRGE